MSRLIIFKSALLCIRKKLVAAVRGPGGEPMELKEYLRTYRQTHVSL